jgi:hypothetical protein
MTLDGGELLASSPRGNQPQDPLDWSWYGHCSEERNPATTGNWTPIIQPIACHYNEWSIPACSISRVYWNCKSPDPPHLPKCSSASHSGEYKDYGLECNNTKTAKQVCMYKGWAMKTSPCIATFNDRLCLNRYVYVPDYTSTMFQKTVMFVQWVHCLYS